MMFCLTTGPQQWSQLTTVGDLCHREPNSLPQVVFLGYFVSVMERLTNTDVMHFINKIAQKSYMIASQDAERLQTNFNIHS
jgi:hypothetical protein